MSSGAYSLEVPHICGEAITVEVKWWYHSGSWDEPPDGDTEWSHADRCPKCGVDLNLDTLFQNTIEQMDAEQDDRGEYMPGDEEDYDPEEYEEFEDPIDEEDDK